MGRPTEESDSLVDEKLVRPSRIQSSTGHVESGKKMGGPPSKPKYYLMTDSGEVLWRKGEKNPGRGVKQNLKPYVYKHSKHIIGAMRYFL